MTHFFKESVGRVALVLSLFALCVFISGSPANAQEGVSDRGEPVKQFVDRLKSAGYFEFAANYLERVREMPGVSKEVKQSIPLDLANVYVDSAVAARTPADRDKAFLSAQAQLEEFVKQTSHQRYAEARTMLAKLQLLRATQLMRGEPTEAVRQTARKAFQAASGSFDTLNAELKTKLEAMQGQKIDSSKEPEKAALRKQYYAQYIDSKVNAARATQLAAMTFENPGSDGKALLEDAVERFEGIFDTFADFPIGAISMRNVGDIRRELGEQEKAIDAYLRMLEQPDVAEVREGKIAAASGLAKIWLAKKPPKYDLAIQRGQPIIDEMLPNERNLGVIQDLRLELGRAYLLKHEDKDKVNAAERKKAKSLGRKLLREASKVGGPHLEPTKELLANIGFEAGEEKEEAIVEDPKTFDEGFVAMQTLLRQISTLQNSLVLLKDGGKPDAEIEAVEKDLRQSQLKTIAIIRRSLRLVTAETETKSVNQSRQILAFMLREQDRHREAAVVGRFIARQLPGTRTGLDGGLVALGALQKLTSAVSGDRTSRITTEIQQLGGYLSRAWPDDPRAAAAQGVMIQLALKDDRFDEAKKLIEDMGEGPKQASFYRLLGQLTWNRSIQARMDKDDELAEKLWKESADQLVRGLAGLDADPAPAEAVQAALILARVHLRLGQPAKALGVLDNQQFGPVGTLGRVAVASDRFLSDLYTAELQAAVGEMTTGSKQSSELLDRASEAMGKLVESSQGPDSAKKLVRIFLGLSREIRDRIDRAEGDQKAALVEAFRRFLSRISESSKDAATLQWAGQQLMQFGEALMAPDQRVADGEALELIESSTAIFQRQLEQSDDPPLSVKFQLARGKRLTAKYSAAIDLLEEILLEKPSMLDAQIEAALAYEQYAASAVAANKANVAVKIYDAALRGARKNAKGKNTIWGWGTISLLTQRDPNRAAEFFNARYHIAACRLRQGQAAASDKIKRQAVKDITSVASRFPELGGPEQRKKFDRLLRKAQKATGESATGLPE